MAQLLSELGGETHEDAVRKTQTWRELCIKLEDYALHVVCNAGVLLVYLWVCTTGMPQPT